MVTLGQTGTVVVYPSCGALTQLLETAYPQLHVIIDEKGLTKMDNKCWFVDVHMRCLVVTVQMLRGRTILGARAYTSC